MPWQRKIIEQRLSVEDLTVFDPGDEVIWDMRQIVACPNCGRSGVEFANGVVHMIADDGRVMECCVDDAPVGAPTTILYDLQGKVLKSWNGSSEPEEQN